MSQVLRFSYFREGGATLRSDPKYRSVIRNPWPHAKSEQHTGEESVSQSADSNLLHPAGKEATLSHRKPDPGRVFAIQGKLIHFHMYSMYSSSTALLCFVFVDFPRVTVQCGPDVVVARSRSHSFDC